MDQELILFCRRWLDKASTYNDNDLKDCFDKFFSLFVVYNALYVEATRRMMKAGTIKPNQGGDRISATKHVPTYLGHSSLAHLLKNDAIMSHAINRFTELIHRGDFYIHTNKLGEAERSEDRSSIRKIRQGDDKEFCESCLLLIYLTRCNMFHGGKQFIQYQKDLLDPMMTVLLKVINELKEKLVRSNNSAI